MQRTGRAPEKAAVEPVPVKNLTNESTAKLSACSSFAVRLQDHGTGPHSLANPPLTHPDFDRCREGAMAFHKICGEFWLLWVPICVVWTSNQCVQGSPPASFIDSSFSAMSCCLNSI